MPQFSNKLGLRDRHMHPVLVQSTHPCPVCGYGLTKPAADFTICPCCGIEFGYGDAGKSYQELRDEWVEYGTHWSSKVVTQPADWDPWKQLKSAALSYSVPLSQSSRTISNKPK